MSESFSIIPAQSGWFVIMPCVDENGRVSSLAEDPIIAWRIETWEASGNPVSVAYPITEECFSLEEYAIRRPDGSICFADDRTFHNQTDALEYFIEKAGEKNARREAGQH